jgi:hypothetical protein
MFTFLVYGFTGEIYELNCSILPWAGRANAVSNRKKKKTGSVASFKSSPKRKGFNEKREGLWSMPSV